MRMRQRRQQVINEINNAVPIVEESVETGEKLSWWQQLLPPAILTVLTALFYWPSLHYPFQFDDIANISKKFAIRYDNPLERWARSSRWLGDWLNRINYQWGRFDSVYYRSVNLVIHLITGLLVFYIIRELCRCVENKTFFHKNGLLIAFVTAGLFLLHPVQTQTVSYVIQARVEGLASLFAVLLVFCFIKAITVKNNILRWLSTALLFAVAIPAWGTKEIIIVVPLLLLLVDWFFISKEQWQEFKGHLLLHVVFDIYFVALAFNYLTTRLAVDVISLKTSLTNNRGNILTEQAYDLITPYQFLISEFKVILHYLWMFVWPFGVSVEYDWKLATSFWAFDSLAPFLALVGIYGAALYGAIKRKYTLVAFGLFWFLICVLPRSSIIPSSELVCDYKSYLASVGWLFILAAILVLIVTKIFDFLMIIVPTVAEKLARKEVQVITLAVVMLPLGIFSVMRNTIWESDVNFWADCVQKAPLKARVHNNYGVALNQVGRIDESIEAYKKAISLDKHYSDPLSNIAVAYCLKNDIDKAIEAAKGALNICPEYPEAYNNLGSLYIKKQQYDDAEQMLNKAIALRPYYGKAFYNLGRLYLEKKQEETAWNYFKKATEGDLDNPDGFYTFAQMSMRLKKYHEAVRAFEQVVERGCSNEQVWFGLANANFMLTHYDKAEAIYARLVRDNPLESKYLYNWGETCFIRKNYSKACELFKKVTTLPRPLPQAFLRVAKCFECMNLYADARMYLDNVLKVNAPEEFKKVVKNELMRITLQEKLNQGKGSIALNDLKKALAIGGAQPSVGNKKQVMVQHKKV